MRYLFRVLILLIAAASLAFIGCENGGGAALDVAAEVDTDSTGSVAAVLIMENLSFVADATVTVNDENVPYFLFGYAGAITTVNGGDTATLKIQRGGTNINSTLTMPNRPTVSAPTAGTYDASNALLVQWGAITTPPAVDNIVVKVDDDYTVDSDGYEVFLSSASTSHSIPGGTLKSSTSNITVRVGGMNYTNSLGSGTTAGSGYAVANWDESAAFSTQ